MRGLDDAGCSLSRFLKFSEPGLRGSVELCGMHRRNHASAAPSEAQRRILIVDDHELIREGIAAVIAHEPDLTICGSVADEREAAQLIERNGPNLVILDLLLGNRDGLQLL